MKKLSKRILSWVLALTMTFSTLPLNAWAARIEDDATPATPVVDGKDGVVDTLAKSGKDDDVTPIDPIDPDPGPVDPNWADWRIEITKLTDDGEFEVTVTTVGTGGDDDAANYGFVLVPDVRDSTRANTKTPSQIFEATSGTMITTTDTTTTALRGKLALANLPLDTVAFFKQQADGTLVTSGGTAIISGTLPQNAVDMLATLGNGNYVDREGNVISSSIPMYAILVTQGGQNGKTASEIKTYGGGVPSAVYVINLDDDSIQQNVGGSLQVTDATFDPASGDIKIPLPNSSPDNLYAFYASSGSAQAISKSGHPDLDVSGSGMLLIPGEGSNELYLNLSSSELGTAIFTLPLYDDADPDDPAPKASPTITVIVVQGNLPGAPLTFHVTVDASGAATVTEDNGLEISVMGLPGGVTGLLHSGDLGTDPTFDDDSGSLSYVEGPAALDDGFIDAWGDQATTLIFGSATSEYNDGETVTGSAKVELEPSVFDNYANDDTLTAELIIYEAGAAAPLVEGTTTVREGTYQINVPITIIITVETTEHVYEVKYDANGGSITSGSATQSNTNGATALAFPTVSRSYYHQTGWFTATSGGTQVTSGTLADYDGQTLYAQWAADTFDVEYHYSGTTPSGATPPTKQTGIAAGTDNHTLTKPSAVTGWQWNGWVEGTSTAAGAGSVITTVSKNQTDGTTVHVWGTWTRLQSNIKFVYDNDAGTTTTETGNTGEALAAAKFPSSAGTKTNYRFLSWKGDDGVTYSSTSLPNFPTTADATLTITAQWQAQSSVTFDTNGGVWSGTTDTTKTYTGDADATLGSTTPVSYPAAPTKSGYTFSGWTKASDSSTVQHANIGSQKFPNSAGGSETYTAIWSAQPATVTVTVLKDTIGYSGQTVDLRTSSTASSAAVSLGTTGTTGVVSSSNVPTNADGSNKTYYVFVGGNYVNETVTVAPGGTDTATVNYWTVTLNAGTGATSPKVNTANGSLVVLDGTTGVTMSASAQTYYNSAAATWTKAAGTNITAASDQTSNSVTLEAVTATTTYSVSFAKLKADITVNFSVDGTVGWPTGYTSISVTGPDGNAWTASNTNTSKVYSLDQGNSYTVSSGNYSRTINPLTAAGATVTIPYYTMTATTLGHGKVKVESGTLSAETTNVANNSVSIIVPYQANATWTATADTNYTVTKWNNVADTATTKTENSVTEAKTKTVEFSKNKFNTYLKLNVNGEHQDAFSSTHANIQNVQLVTANNGTTAVSGVTVTHDNTNQVWAATGIPSTVTPYWRVTTVDGGVYYTAASVADKTTDATIAAATATENLFGITIEGGAGNDATNKPTLKAQTGSTAGERIVTRAGVQTTVTLNAKAGYTFKSPYLAGNATAPTADLTAAQGTGSATAFTLASGYTAPASHADLYIKPQYTFSVTVRTVRGSTPTAPGGTVVINDGTTDTTLTGTNGSYSAANLDPSKTYTITVNGFKSSVIFDKDNAGGNVDVPLYTVTTKVKSMNAGTESDNASAGTAYVNRGTVGATTNTSIYLPKGATTDATHTVNLKAAASSGYRAADSVTNTGDSDLWTTTSTGASVPAATKNTAETTLTIAGDDGLVNDVEVVAHFVLRYTATVKVAPTGSSSTAKYTAPNATTVTVDAGKGAEAVFAKAVGETLTGWTVTNGLLYSDSTLATQITTPATHTGTTVYFKPTANNAELTANVEAAKYPVTVNVKLDNGEYGGRTVQLKKTNTADATVEYTLTAGSTTSGVYTGNILPGRYYIWVDGVTTGTTAATAKELNFSAANAEATPAVNTSATVNYYTIVLKADPAGVGNTVAFSGSTANQTSTSKIVLAPTAGGSIGNVVATAYNNDSTGTHYRFDKWEVTAPTANGGSMGNTANATTTYSLPTEATLTANTNITTSSQITLTAYFVQQYKVTVTNGTTAPSNEFTVQLKKTGDTNWASTKSILVDAGDTVTINGYASGGGTESATRVLSEWTLEDNTSGTFDNSSHTATPKPANGTTGYVLQNGVYTPAKDSVLVLNAWQMETPVAGWVFDKGTGTATSPTGAAERRTTWRNADGQAPTKVTVKNATGTAALTDDLATTDYAVSGTNNEYYTITAKHLRDSVLNGTYTLNFEYVLGPANHPNNVNKVATSTNFIVTSNKHKLTETNVQVKDKTSNTANPTASTGRDGVIYKDHTAAAPNIEYDELIFTWYYADAAPTQTNFNSQTDPAAAAKTAAAAVSGATLIGTTGATGVSAWTEGANSIATGAVKVTDAMRGKFIYAVVEVDKDSETAEGAVITNAIVVDYDAKITVNEDGALVPVADAAGYSVYLWPTTGGTFNKSTAIPANYNSTSGLFETTGGALNANTSYNVYVQEVESNTTAAYIMLTGAANVVSRTGPTATANYYTVTLTDVTAAKVTHAKDNSSPQKDVGETFTSYPTFNAATGNSTSIPSGKGVLAGSTVTAKANALSGKTVGWDQDYALTWQNKAGAAASFTDVTGKQTNATAVSTGYRYTTNLANKVEITGKLDQNTYDIKGDVKATGGKAANPKLKVVNGGTTYTFNGSFDANNGSNGSVVTFTVPRSEVTGAISGKYVLSAEPASGSTLKGYCVPSGAAATTEDPIQLQTVTAAGTGKFTIFIEATELKMKVEDNDTSNKHSVESSNPNAFVNATHPETWLFANYTAPWTKTITVTNTGNTPLDVTLVLQKSTNGGTSWTDIYKTGTALTGNTDAANNVTFANLADTFSLGLTTADNSKSFTITAPDDLDNNDDVTYRFSFTTTDGRTGITTAGPKLNFDVKLTINPVQVQAVTIKRNSDNTYEENTLTIQNNTSVDGSSTPTLTRANDLTYQWYVAPAGTSVTLANYATVATAATGTGNNTTKYTPAPADAGKKLYLVVTGKNNATQSAISTGLDVYYKGVVTLMENANTVSDYSDYAVYLSESNTNLDTSTAIQLQHRTGDGNGQYTTEDGALVPGKTYYVWTNTAKGTTTVFRYSTKTITGVTNTTNGTGEATVVYHQVQIGDTTVHQNDYEGKLTIPDNSQYFYKTAPTTLPSAAAAGVTGVNVANSWVQQGTAVTFTYPTWAKDYDLTWSGGVTGTDRATVGNAGNATKTATYSSQLAEVKTQLKLNLYPVAANVKGPVGWVNWITMALNDNGTTNTFTTKSGDGNTLGINDSGLPADKRIGVGKSVTFRLPKADGYTTAADVPSKAESGVTDWGYNYNGVDTNHATSATIAVNVKGVAAQDTYDVVLKGEGLSMTVAETALPTDMTNGATAKSGQASIPDGEADPVNGTVTQEIHLNYNYAAGQTVKVRVSNGDSVRTIYNVTRTEAGTNTTDITASSFTGGEMAGDAYEDLTLTIEDNLPVKAGGYTYSADFSFTNADGDPNPPAKVTYTLTVIVDPLPFTGVTTKTNGDGSHEINTYEVTPDTKSAVTDSPAASGADVKTALTAGTDYLYQWVRADMDATVSASWTNGTLTVTGGTKITTNGTSAKYTPVTADEGKALYLVIYGAANKNAVECAISAPITTGYTGLIKVNKDTVLETGTTDPGYTVNFLPAGGGAAVPGVWNGSNGYAATLNPEVASYTVEVCRAKGDSTMETLTGVTITNANRDGTANYFTVNAVNFTNEAYQTGTGETFTGNITPAFTIGTDKAALPNNTPVLSGQSIEAKAPETATGSGIAWTQDYTLNWQAKTDNAITGTTTTFAGTDDKTPTTVTAANATKDAGAYGQTVDTKTFIGGRLIQTTYDVLGNIKNLTGDTGGSVLKAELTFKPGTGDTRNFLLTTNQSDTATGHIKANNSIVNDNNDSTIGNVGDYMTFRVVKGVYDIAAFDGTNTTIQRVTVGGGNDPVVTAEVNDNTTRNLETLTPQVAQADREFTVYVAATDMKLGVTDDEKPTANSALSVGVTGNNANQHADNTEVHYFNATTGTFNLTLNNPGNTDLKVTAAVYKFANMAAVPNYATGTWTGAQTIAGDRSYTSTDILKITSILANNTAVNVGDTAIPAGKITLDAKADNADDGVYVVRFTSTYADTNGNTPAGPTVYYVLDLTVQPLPIVKVTAEKDLTKTDGTLRLKDFVASGTNANDGLTNVEVSSDGSNDTTKFVDATTANLNDTNDILFVWAVSDRDDLTKDDFALNTTTNKITSTVATVDSTNGKTRTPIAAEQGKYFYLIAYRKDANSNASEFAVSDAIYAQVTISLKTQRYSDKTQVADTSVQIQGIYGTGETAISAKSNSGTLVIPVANGEIAFTADEADNATPASAKYYFVGWGPENDDRVEVDADDRLAMTYTATKQDTVIGYYDLLPVLTGANGCTIGAATIPAADRTFTYTHNDGSGNVRIEIKPADGSHFLAVTGDADEDLTSPRVLNATAFEKIAGQTSGGTIGANGDYVLTNSWITANLDGDQDYIITFFDLEKGVEVDGYAGYDRSKAYVTSTGDKDVTAVVADDNKGQGHTVQVTNGGVSDGTVGETSTASTVNGVVTIHANPGAGYVFTGWTITAGSGRFLEDGGATKEETTFRPTSLTATVEAAFEPAEFEVTDGKAVVIYGNGDFEAGSKTDVAVSSQESTNMSFTYTVATEAELKALDAGGNLPADYTAKPDWLTLNANGTFTFTTNAKATGNNVEVTDPTATSYSDTIRVEDEVVVYVKIMEEHSEEVRYAKFVVDVEPGELTVEHANTQQTSAARGEAYKAANTAAGTPIPVDEDGIPMYNQTVLKYLFAYEQVKDQANTTIDNTGVAGDQANDDSGEYTNGTWKVSPARFQGTGETSTYTFTFTYKPDDADEKWNYAAAKTDMTLIIAKPPVGAEFADEIANADDVRPGTWDEDYSTVQSPEDYDGTSGAAPEAMAYTNNTYRFNETITYLDAEPKYTVKLRSLDAAIHGATFTEEELTGFALADGTSYPTFTNDQFSVADGEKTFVLELAPISGKLWVGTHHAKFTLTGYASADELEEGGDPTVVATYELTVIVEPKVITELDVTVTEPKDKPDEVKGKLDGDPDDKDPTDLTKPDDKGNTPVKETTSTWGPDDGPDDKKTEVKVKVEIDPNYIYTKGDPEDPDDTPDITETTDLTVTDHLTPPPTVERQPLPNDPEDDDHIVLITQMIPYLMHDDVLVDSDPANTTGPKVDDRRTVSVLQGATGLGSYEINLGAYGSDVYNVKWSIAQNTITGTETGIGAVLKDSEGNELTWNEAAGTIATAGPKGSFVLDLSTADTSKPGTYTLTLLAEGKANETDEDWTIQSTYVFQLTIRANNPPSPPDPCPCKVFYHIGINGTTSDPTVEDVSESSRPSKVPTVTAVDGYTFRGWSLTNPATLKNGEQPVLVDPRTVQAKGDTMIFYAVMQKTPYHEHYVVGYPNGTFGPGDDINRASVATIIARAILPDFVEGANYGNPGGYSDVSGHWAESAIAYCSKFGVFEGMPDGTFQPNRPITRQEFALVMARLDGVMKAGEMTVTDADDIASWALDGVYTTYVRGWVNGYPDGSFKPLNNIRRDEAVKVFNAYLKRGVDADGLHDLHEYVYPDKNTGNDFDQYKTWPDVPANHWAYYEIIEAANDHAFEAEMDGTYTVPETWTKCWINERWGLNNINADAAMVSAGFQVWFH